jgi:hypothetical protein
MKTKTKKKVSQTPSKRRTSRNGQLGQSLPIDRIRELYHGESVAVHLTKVDRYNNPIAGVVVAHSKNEEDFLQQAMEYRLKHPKAKVYTFFAGNYIPEGWVVVLDIGQ